MSAPHRSVQRVFRTGRFRFEDGTLIKGLDTAYWTAGELNAARDNVVFLCHGASGNKDWPGQFVRSGGAFDPRHWFLISADMPGGGGSSRRSNDPSFPDSYTVTDISEAFSALLDGLSITRLRAFCGASLASLVGLSLASRRPDLVGALVLWTGSFRSDGFARATAESLISILELSPTPGGLRAAVRAFVPALVSREAIASMSASKYGALVESIASEWLANWRADELITRYRAIARCDLAVIQGGEQRLAESIQCPVLWLQASADAIFPLDEVRRFAKLMRSAQVKMMATSLGHLAPTAPMGAPEFEFFDRETAHFLAHLRE